MLNINWIGANETAVFFEIFFVFCLSFHGFLAAQDAEQLKRQDVNKIMEQIFSEHLGEKQINEEILKHSLKSISINSILIALIYYKMK